MKKSQKSPMKSSQVKTETSGIPEYLTGRIDGPIELAFTRHMFLAGSTSRAEFRIHRSKALKELTALYDRMAQGALDHFRNRDPEGDYPDLEKIGYVVIDSGSNN